MNIGARIGCWSNGLPYDRKLNYIESSGTQYIETGIVIPVSADFHVKAQCTSIISNGCLFGESKEFLWGASNPAYGIANAGAAPLRMFLRCSNTAGSNIFIQEESVGADFEIYSNGGSVFYNDTQVATFSRERSWTTTPATMNIFRRNYFDYKSSSDTYGSYRLKEVSFFNGTSSIIDLIPVLATFNGSQEACLYNKAYDGTSAHGSQFYRNAGTGVFTYG